MRIRDNMLSGYRLLPSRYWIINHTQGGDMKEYNLMQKWTYILANSCKGNPILTTCTIMLFYVMFNMVEAQIERLIFGERFEHWLDIVFQLCAIAYAAYAVYWCALYNNMKNKQ